MKEVVNATINVATNGEPAAGAISTLIEKGISYYDKKRNERIKSFYEELYQGTVEDERLEYERQIEVNADDFYGILSATIEDEEKEKTSIYVNLFKAIRDTDSLNDKKVKYQAIKIAKDLPYSALEIMKNTHIEGLRYKDDEPIGGKTAYQAASDAYLKRMNSISLRFELNKLEQYTMINKDSHTGEYKMSAMALSFTLSYFSENELKI